METATFVDQAGEYENLVDLSRGYYTVDGETREFNFEFLG